MVAWLERNWYRVKWVAAVEYGPGEDEILKATFDEVKRKREMGSEESGLVGSLGGCVKGGDVIGVPHILTKEKAKCGGLSWTLKRTRRASNLSENYPVAKPWRYA